MAVDTERELTALKRFRANNADLFEKDDRLLVLHLTAVLSILAAFTFGAVASTFLPVKILCGACAAFFWFALVNVTIHHHVAHHNAASSRALTWLLDALYYLVPARKSRYIRAHLNHHARPFHETDVDHRFGVERYLAVKHSPVKRLLYFLELTFVGAFIPGLTEDAYLNRVPMDQWNIGDYKDVMRRERWKSIAIAIVAWALFLAGTRWFPWFAWGWLFPMLLVKNWAHFFGQFQHYDETLLKENDRSAWRRTKSFHVPRWFNYLVGGEISGHFVHHLFPQIPYYRVESARERLVADAEMASLFVIY